jgi:hypothetical protein
MAIMLWFLNPKLKVQDPDPFTFIPSSKFRIQIRLRFIPTEGSKSRSANVLSKAQTNFLIHIRLYFAPRSKFRIQIHLRLSPAQSSDPHLLTFIPSSKFLIHIRLLVRLSQAQILIDPHPLAFIPSSKFLIPIRLLLSQAQTS